MTQVKKRLSKKSKGSWRKIEHNDVENFLEDQRLEERMGYVLRTISNIFYFYFSFENSCYIFI